jgi:arginyl-tRNA--protein-N-Asp/Glu arginylyltransferase
MRNRRANIAFQPRTRYGGSVSDWQFGKLSAMYEIALAYECGLPNYYMGYYIHSCIKMRYKREYKPQLVLGQCLALSFLSRRGYIFPNATFLS